MFGSDILDIAIGVVFVFLFASLICSAIGELISSLLKLRARELQRGIGELVGDPTNATRFLEQIYDHGLVNGLFRGNYRDSANVTMLRGLLSRAYRLPSYVPPKNFALALIQIVRDPPPGVTIPQNVVTAVRAIASAAGNDFEKISTGIEQWYDSAMDRVAGWYKRRIQCILIVTGLLLAFFVNIDILAITRMLSEDSALRKTVVAAAQAYANTPRSAGDKIDPQQAIRTSYNELKDLGLPVCFGCTWGWPPKWSDAVWWRDRFFTPLVGYLITAFAVSFGAPFWFDLLNRLIVVRSTVKPREKSQEEPSKD